MIARGRPDSGQQDCLHGRMAVLLYLLIRGHAAGCSSGSTKGVGGKRVDFFVSHAGADRALAEWVAWQLAEAGYTVELDVWDWAAGRNFVTAMSDALERCDRVVALFSAAYFDRSRYTTEWSAAMLHLSGMAEGRLVPVRMEKIPAGLVPAMLRPLMSRMCSGCPRSSGMTM